MSNIKKRIYNSVTRHAQAAQTRSRILVAAKELLHTEGFDFMTIEKLAKIAKVSVPTVYSLFQSKRGILRALMDEALPLDQYERLVEESKQEISAKSRLAISAKISRQMYDAERAQMFTFQGAAMLAPEFRELEKERELRRYTRQEVTIKSMVKEKSLAKGISISKARDILWAFTGRDMYRMFVVEQEWSSDEYEKWLGELLVKTLVRKQ